MFFTDQCGRPVQLNSSPQRIVSLVPSQTELLYDLGLDDRVCGITRFCIHPASWHAGKVKVGGTKAVNMQTIKSLNPDLILANKEENEREQVEALAREYPVWVSDVSSLDDALSMIHAIGKLTATDNRASSLSTDIAAAFRSLQKITAGSLRFPGVAYLIWQKPYMAAGGGTFIDAMMNACGFDNMLKQAPRYPEVTVSQLVEMDCRMVLLSSEPYPFKEQHRSDLQELMPGAKIVLVDGEMFSWYGSRLLQAPGYFIQLLDGLG